MDVHFNRIIDWEFTITNISEQEARWLWQRCKARPEDNTEGMKDHDIRVNFQAAAKTYLDTIK